MCSVAMSALRHEPGRHGRSLKGLPGRFAFHAWQYELPLDRLDAMKFVLLPSKPLGESAWVAYDLPPRLLTISARRASCRDMGG